MSQNKLLVGMLIGLLFGLCFAIPLRGGNNSIGDTHWYAQLSDNTDQIFASAGNSYAINFSTNDEIDGISHIEGEFNITIIYDGVYQFVVQPQVCAGAGDAGKFHMWCQKDTGVGFVDVDNCNVELTLDSLDADVIPLSAVMKLEAGNIIRIMASVTDNGIQLDAQTPAGEPAIPSIILSIVGHSNN